MRLKVAGQTRHMTFPLPLTQSDLADTLGPLGSPCEIRVLKILRAQRFILLEGHTVTILDWDDLGLSSPSSMIPIWASANSTGVPGGARYGLALERNAEDLD